MAGPTGGRPKAKAGPSAAKAVRLRDFSKSLPMSLLRAREALMRHFRPGLRHFGVTEQQWRVLRALSSVPCSEVLALAQSTFLLAPSLSKILKGLEKRGLIDRRTPDEDMRRGLVSISPRGLELLERAGRHSETVYREIARRFGADRIAALQQMLAELEAAASRSPAIAGLVRFETEPYDAGVTATRGRPRKQAVQG